MLTTVTLMPHVPTLLGVSPVPVTKDMLEMEKSVLVCTKCGVIVVTGRNRISPQMSLLNLVRIHIYAYIHDNPLPK